MSQKSDLTRLLEEADQQLADPENNRRHTSVSHLRAAVKSARAKSLLEGMEYLEAQDSVPYKNDLIEAVSHKYSDTRPARKQTPLTLVAEQRIDLNAPLELHDEVSETFETFAQYSESLGAETLEDKLMAAALYLKKTKGLDKFSRPELMGTLYSDDPGTFSREDSLLSFGFLLKEGRLKKLPGGQFEAVPELDDAQNHQRVG